MIDSVLKNPQDNNLSTKIIEAARELFMENGFKGTTTKMIAQKAGVNEATLFRHFKSKEGIFLEMSNGIENYSHTRLISILESDIPPEEMFYQFGMELYRRIVESKGVLIVAIIESKKRSGLSKNVTKVFKNVIEILEKRMTALYEEGIFKENDFFIASLMYVESLIGLFVVQSRLEGEMIPVEIERLCRSASKIFLQGLVKADT